MEPITTAQSLAYYLRRRRLLNNHTQAQISRALGMGLSTYRQMESGSDTVALSHWVRVWQHFGIQDNIVAAMGDDCDLCDEFDEVMGQSKPKLRARSRS